MVWLCRLQPRAVCSPGLVWAPVAALSLEGPFRTRSRVQGAAASGLQGDPVFLLALGLPMARPGLHRGRGASLAPSVQGQPIPCTACWEQKAQETPVSSCDGHPRAPRASPAATQSCVSPAFALGVLLGTVCLLDVSLRSGEQMGSTALPPPRGFFPSTESTCHQQSHIQHCPLDPTGLAGLAQAPRLGIIVPC